MHANATAPTDSGQAHLNELAAALIAQGLTVKVDDRRPVVTVTNTAAEPDNPRDPLAVAYGPTRLTQRVRLADHDGEPWWHWEWSGPTREAPPDTEPLCRAGDIERAAAALARVVALAIR